MAEREARKSFRLKVELLEKATASGVIPPEYPIIAKVKDLQSWDTPPLTSWKSFSVAAPGGRNADLRARFDRILPSFKKLQTGKSMRGPRPPKDRSVETWLIQSERDALCRQNAEILMRLREAEAALRAKEAMVESSKAKIAELTERLSVLIPLSAAKRSPPNG
ncbi:hypothetical protein [Qipengyuania sp.]|uniref:hypothetical protein n=1 Tax=Qipengyuania sp. TaxID=2004515 RepID=UPI003AF9C275